MKENSVSEKNNLILIICIIILLLSNCIFAFLWYDTNKKITNIKEENTQNSAKQKQEENIEQTSQKNLNFRKVEEKSNGIYEFMVNNNNYILKKENSDSCDSYCKLYLNDKVLGNDGPLFSGGILDVFINDNILIILYNSGSPQSTIEAYDYNGNNIKIDENLKNKVIGGSYGIEGNNIYFQAPVNQSSDGTSCDTYKFTYSYDNNSFIKTGEEFINNQPGESCYW